MKKGITPTNDIKLKVTSPNDLIIEDTDHILSQPDYEKGIKRDDVTSGKSNKTTTSNNNNNKSNQRKGSKIESENKAKEAAGNDDEKPINPTDQQPTDQIVKTTKEPSMCRRLTMGVFSNIGLIAAVIIYSIVGAFLFQLLEQHEEAKRCQEGKGAETTNIVNLKSKLLTYIQFNITSNPADLTKDNETVANSNLEEWLKTYRDDVLTVYNDHSFTGQDCDVTQKWTFAGSLLFAITIITTIGK
jgi:hypothetical protein